MWFDHDWVRLGHMTMVRVMCSVARLGAKPQIGLLFDMSCSFFEGCSFPQIGLLLSCDIFS